MLALIPAQTLDKSTRRPCCACHEKPRLSNSSYCSACNSAKCRERAARHAKENKEARVDPRALKALLATSGDWRVTQSAINALADERRRLWVSGTWRPMSEQDRERCELITAMLPGLWDSLRRELAAQYSGQRIVRDGGEAWAQRR